MNNRLKTELRKNDINIVDNGLKLDYSIQSAVSRLVWL